MVEGLLWFDSDPNRKLADKIDRAVQRYHHRLHSKPTICYVNIKDFDEQHPEINGILLKTKDNILPHHYLIGIE